MKYSTPASILMRTTLGMACLAGNLLAAPCSYVVSPLTASQPYTGGAGVFAMTVNNGCAWSATSTNTWLQTTNSGSGNGQILYTADANTSELPRVGYISAGGKVVSVSQGGVPPSLGQALNCPQLTWQTSPGFPWYGTNQPAPTFDGVASAASGNRYVQDSTSWLETQVVGPGRLSFWWRVDSDVTPEPPEEPWSFDALEFLLNGESLSKIMGAQEWGFRSYDIPSGTNSLTWRYVKDPQYNLGEDQGWVDQVTYSTNTEIPLAVALNTCAVEWTSGGNTNPTLWQSQSTYTHDGTLAARSGAITHNQEAWLQATVSGITNLSFWWSVSSETNFDFLEFFTNNVLATRISGEVSWTSNYFTLSGGTNVLRWRYVKNSLDYLAKGLDAAWLDEVKFSPSQASTAYMLGLPEPLEDGTIRLSILATEVGCPCQVLVSTNLLNWQTLTNLTTLGPVTTFIDPSPGGHPARYYRAASP